MMISCSFSNYSDADANFTWHSEPSVKHFQEGNDAYWKMIEDRVYANCPYPFGSTAYYEWAEGFLTGSRWC